MYHRRARPTLRLLREDLVDGWESPWPRRSLVNGDVDALHPLSELPHPIVAKATECFGGDPANDSHHGRIAASTELPLLEIKAGQWRAGVWEDRRSGVHWLLVAGLAKGNHQDRDDFYERVKRENNHGDPRQWLPTDEDRRLLKEETAARLITTWELGIQRQVLASLAEIHSGGSQRMEIQHPLPDTGATVAHVTILIDPVREPGYEADEIEVEVTPRSRYAGSDLVWRLAVRVIASLSPPEQSWDRDGDSYSNIAEPGTWTTRLAELSKITADCELVDSEPGTHSHYAHRTHLAGSTIEGTAVRALCGVFFVPRQDHERLPVCRPCEQRLAELPHFAPTD